jgi:hypothetical protein
MVAITMVPLTKGQTAVVDESDAPLVQRFKWHAVLSNGRVWYAQTKMWLGGKRRTVMLHRFILSPPPGLDVDHINNDGLDCRRSNLRVCTRRQNLANMRPRSDGTSRFKGVSRLGRKWAAAISPYGDGSMYHIGVFEDEADAAVAYDLAARLHFGEFARLNFPEDAA